MKTAKLTKEKQNTKQFFVIQFYDKNYLVQEQRLFIWSNSTAKNFFLYNSKNNKENGIQILIKNYEQKIEKK